MTTRIFRHGNASNNSRDCCRGRGIFWQCAFWSFTVTSIEQIVANCSRPSSTVRSKPAHASRSLRIIRYASITTNTCPRVLSSFLTYTGRTSRFTVLHPRNTFSTSVKSLYRSCTRYLSASFSFRSVLIT